MLKKTNTRMNAKTTVSDRNNLVFCVLKPLVAVVSGFLYIYDRAWYPY